VSSSASALSLAIAGRRVLALVLRVCCACAALVLRLCCACAALVLRLCCACAALVLRLCCACAALVLRLCCACAALVRSAQSMDDEEGAPLRPFFVLCALHVHRFHFPSGAEHRYLCIDGSVPPHDDAESTEQQGQAASGAGLLGRLFGRSRS
jgi:hypothetical protein